MPHPLSARRCTMLFHLFILLQLLSPGDLVCVRRLLSTDEEGSQDQEGEMTLKNRSICVHPIDQFSPIVNRLSFPVTLPSVCRRGGRTFVPGSPSAVQPVRLWDLRPRESREGVLWRSVQLWGGEGGFWEHPGHSEWCLVRPADQWRHTQRSQQPTLLMMFCFFCRTTFGRNTLRVRNKFLTFL